MAPHVLRAVFVEGQRHLGTSSGFTARDAGFLSFGSFFAAGGLLVWGSSGRASGLAGSFLSSPSGRSSAAYDRPAHRHGGSFICPSASPCPPHAHALLVLGMSPFGGGMSLHVLVFFGSFMSFLSLLSFLSLSLLSGCGGGGSLPVDERIDVGQNLVLLLLRVGAGVGLFELVADVLRVLDDAVHDDGRVFGLRGGFGPGRGRGCRRADFAGCGATGSCARAESTAEQRPRPWRTASGM